jgi:hypothetical protein
MQFRVRLLLVIFLSLSTVVATTSAQQSCFSSQTVSPPLGTWEAMDPHDGYIGIDFSRGGVASGNGTSLAPPKASEVVITVYHRRPADHCVDEHFFSLTWHCGEDKAAAVTFEKDKLVIRFPRRPFKGTPIDVGLLFDQDRSVWRGNFRLGIFHDLHATLSRAHDPWQELLRGEPCQ